MSARLYAEIQALGVPPTRRVNVPVVVSEIELGIDGLLANDPENTNVGYVPDDIFIRAVQLLTERHSDELDGICAQMLNGNL